MKVVWILDMNQNQVQHLKSVSYDENEIQSGPIWYDDGESRLFGQLWFNNKPIKLVWKIGKKIGQLNWISDINQNEFEHLKSVSYDENEIQSGPIWYVEGESRLFRPTLIQ